MYETTNEFSFVLKPSAHGIGVFATHGIKKGTHLRLFGADEKGAKWRDRKDVPKLFWTWCLELEDDRLFCPEDFGRMHLGWYMNHSRTPSAENRNLVWYALRDIEEGEEITADYNSFNEVESAKEDFYNT